MSGSKSGPIDELMSKAGESLSHTAYFEAERIAVKAMGMARQASDFDRMARIVMPLLEARRQRLQQALDLGTVTIHDEPVTEDLKITPGCYLIRPPQVGADARRLRLAAMAAEVPVAVLCREPKTQLRMWPMVAISPGSTVRTMVDPPDDEEAPDVAWYVDAMEAIGDAAIASLDSQLESVRRVDALVERIDAIPDHEGLHHALEEACRTAMQAAAAPKPPSRKRRSAAT